MILSASQVAGDVLAFCGVVSVLFVGVGLAALDALRIKSRSLLEQWTLALSVGLVLTCLLAFLTGFVWPHLVVVIAGPVGLYGLWRHRPRRGSDPDEARPTLCERLAEDGPVAALSSLALVSVVPFLTYAEQTGDDVIAFWAYGDHLLHTSTAWEMLRGIPPPQMPFLAGEPFWPYHLFTDLYLTLCLRYGALDPLFAQHVLTHAVVWLAVAAGLGALARRLSGQPWAGALAVALFFAFVGAGQDPLLDLSRNSPHLLAMLMLVAIALALVRVLEEERTGASVVLGLLVGGLFSFKANIFLFVFPAWGAFALHLFLRGQRRAMFLGGLSAAAVLGPMGLFHVTRPQERAVGVDYGAFSRWLAETHGGLLESALDGGGAALGPLFVVLLWGAMIGGALWPGALLAAGLALRRGLPRPALTWLAVMFVAWVAVCLLPVEEGTAQYEAWNVALFSRAAVRLFFAGVSGVGLGVVVAWARARLGPAPRRAAAAALVVGQLGLAAGRLGEGSPHSPVGVPTAWLEAAEAIQQRAPLDAVVASERNLLGATFTSTFTGRRVVVERAVLFGVFFPSVATRLADLALVFESEDPGAVRWLLQRHRVTHLLELGDRPLKARPEGALVRWSEHGRGPGRVTVWEVAPPVGPLGEPPGDLARRREAARRQVAASLRVLQGVPAAAVAAEEGVTRRTLAAWVEATQKVTLAATAR